jgi:hypothetical protein
MDIEMIRELATSINNVAIEAAKPYQEQIAQLQAELADMKFQSQSRFNDWLLAKADIRRLKEVLEKIANIPLQAADYEKAVRFYCKEGLSMERMAGGDE